MKLAKNTISEICEKSENYLMIHYSCESFIDKPDRGTPRVTSIAVRYLKNAQTKTFSIHTIAEQKHLPFNTIEENYDNCEKEMLKQFFSFVKQHTTMKWIHWNMRDHNFGFYAIENRYKVLGGVPVCISDDRKIDLARLLVDRYGKYYIENPRMQKLVEKNHMTKMDFLTGAEEAEAFNNKEYIKLHKSTLRKVDLFSSIIFAAADGTLKTNSKWKDVYGLSLQGVFEALKDKWYFWVITIAISALIGFLPTLI